MPVITAFLNKWHFITINVNERRTIFMAKIIILKYWSNRSFFITIKNKKAIKNKVKIYILIVAHCPF